MHNPLQMFFYQLCFKSDSTKLGHLKKHKVFNSVFKTIHWVKTALQAEPILLTSLLQVEGPAERRRRSRLVIDYMS